MKKPHKSGYTLKTTMAEIPDFDDPKVEEAWIAQQLEHVTWFIDQQDIKRGRIAEWPSFHVVPYLSIWTIESGNVPGAVGWWVISGDLPTDYFSGNTVQHPRQVLLAAAARWAGMLKEVADGVIGEVTIPDLPHSPELQKLLATRVELLQKIAANDEFWAEYEKALEESVPESV